MPCLRRETAFSPESFSEAGSCDLIVVCSVLLRGEVQIIAWVLEPAYYRAAGLKAVSLLKHGIASSLATPL